MLDDMLDHGQRIVEDDGAINTPLLILAAEKDYVVKNSLIEKFFLNIDSSVKEFETIKGAYHGLLFETMRNDIYNHISRFANKCFALPQKETSIQPDRFTVNEYHEMMFKHLPLPAKINFNLMKSMLSKVGKLSDGMTLVMKYGFDSGMSLDYVYIIRAQ